MGVSEEVMNETVRVVSFSVDSVVFQSSFIYCTAEKNLRDSLVHPT